MWWIVLLAACLDLLCASVVVGQKCGIARGSPSARRPL